MLKNMDREDLTRLLLRLLIVFVAMMILVVGCNYLLPVLGRLVSFALIICLPFVIAWIIAIITRPFVRFLRHKNHLPQTLSVLLVIGGLLFLLFGFLYIIISHIAYKLSHITDELVLLQQGLESFSARLHDWLSGLPGGGGLLDQTDMWKSAANFFADQVDKLFTSLPQLLLDMPTVMLFLLVIFVAAFFFCRDEDLPSRFLCRLMPVAKRERVARAFSSWENIIGGWARAQLILSSISTALCIGAYFILGVDDALAMGLLTGALDALPMLGAGFLLIPWIMICFLLGDSQMAVALAIFFLILLAVRNLLEPKMIGDRIGLHPLAALAAAFIGWQLGGVWGLFFGPLVLAFALAFYRLHKQL
jgi:sporulation integral membrane protein YtvI